MPIGGEPLEVPDEFKGSSLAELLKPIQSKQKPQSQKATSFTVPKVRV